MYLTKIREPYLLKHADLIAVRDTEDFYVVYRAII